MKLTQYGLKPIDFNDPGLAPANEGLSRRGFVVSSLASGFAAATLPVSAQTITTDSKGLNAGQVTVTTRDGSIPAYRAMPEGGEKLPILLVVQEIFGVHEHIKDICRRYAKLGYYAIAPELYARQGDVSKMTDINAILSQVVAKVPDAQVNGDLDATLALAKGTGVTDASRLGIVGYCWGGRAVWEYALHNPALKAAVTYYGLLDGMKSDIKPQDPIDFAADIKVPVLGLYAGNDNFNKPAVIEQMRSGLVRSGSGSELVVFPGVSHGFNADYRPSYDKLAADYARKLAHEWLADHGV